MIVRNALARGCYSMLCCNHMGGKRAWHRFRSTLHICVYLRQATFFTSASPLSDLKYCTKGSNFSDTMVFNLVAMSFSGSPRLAAISPGVALHVHIYNIYIYIGLKSLSKHLNSLKTSYKLYITKFTHQHIQYINPKGK